MGAVIGMEEAEKLEYLKTLENIDVSTADDVDFDANYVKYTIYKLKNYKLSELP